MSAKTNAFVLGLLGMVAGLAIACNSASRPQREPKPAGPAKWAKPMPGHAGLPNFHKVSDVLYRGAQPDDEGFATLKKLGIKTVVNLRTLHSDRSECEDAGLGYVHITAQAWEGEDDEVFDFLKIVADKKRQPVFVHCQHGADRTGVMCAAYRIAVQGWSNEDAIREMTQGDFGFHSIWKNLVTYVRKLDPEELRKQAGIQPPSPK